MGRIRSSGSKMETQFVAILQSLCRQPFSVNDPTVFGKPDVAFCKMKVCIFLDSDFWHGWQYPRWRHLLKSDFWRQKIERNRERDRQVSRKLRQQGWRVVRVWEHNLRNDLESTVTHIAESLFDNTQRRVDI